MRTILSIAAAIFAIANAARADIFQWEYINQADPSQGKQQSTTLAPDGAGVNAVPGANLFGRNLTMAYLPAADLSNANLSQANLTNAYFRGAYLTGADFNGTEARGADFGRRCTFDPDFGCTVPIGTGPGTGLALAQLYATASYQANDLTGVNLRWNRGLTGGNFAGQNLTNANFSFATLTGADFRQAYLTNAVFSHARLTDADFSGAVVRGTSFSETGLTLPQIYSTASYQAHDLTGINLSYKDLSGGNFAGQNVTNAVFYFVTLSGADFTAADARGAFGQYFSDATTANLIWPDGHIHRLELDGGQLLVMRDYDGAPTRTNPSNGIPAPLPPIAITIDQHLAMGSGGTLRMVFEADAWDSTISFAPGIPVTLGGTLELTFADDVNLASQVGRTFDLFDWTGVTPTGAFAISSPYAWDLSNIYTTGEVTLTIPEPICLALAAVGAFGLTFYRRRKTL
jgi:uncharacterized protein YjbI with pentapeptide repeats